MTHEIIRRIASSAVVCSIWAAAALGVSDSRTQDHQPAGTPTGPGPTPWFSIETDGEVVEADIAVIRNALTAGAASLEQYFDDPQLTASLQSVSVRVIVHSKPGSLASETTATTRSGSRDGTVATYYADIHILAPSSHSEGALTSIGEPKDAEYFARLIVHELSTVPLDLSTRIKPSGWRWRTAPAWFVQGYEEYLGMTCVAGTGGREALARRTAIVAADPSRVDDAFGLDVIDPYVTGATLIRFMHEQYGEERSRGILTSTERTFGRAVRASLGVGLEEFMGDWRVWIESQRAD